MGECIHTIRAITQELWTMVRYAQQDLSQWRYALSESTTNHSLDSLSVCCNTPLLMPPCQCMGYSVSCVCVHYTSYRECTTHNQTTRSAREFSILLCSIYLYYSLSLALCLSDVRPCLPTPDRPMAMYGVHFKFTWMTIQIVFYIFTENLAVNSIGFSAIDNQG